MFQTLIIDGLRSFLTVQLLVNFIGTVIIYTTNLYRLHDSHFEFLVKLSYYLILEFYTTNMFKM